MEENKFSPEEIISSVQALLPSNETIDVKENLIKQGIESLDIMRIVNEYRKKGSRVKFADLIENPYIENWHKEINKLRKKRNISKQTVSERYEPYDLTPVQFAYFVGRRDGLKLGGVDCHAYLELSGKTIDEKKLNEAYKKLQLHHPMLHTKFLPEGKQQEIKDFVPRELSVYEVSDEADFLKLRESISHRKLDIENAQTFEIALVKFSNGIQKLIYDVSLVIADVISFQKIMEDLCKLYNGEELSKETAEFSFKEYLKNNSINDKPEDREYWLNQIENLPDNPQIPLRKRDEDIEKVRFNTRSCEISPEIWKKIKNKALSASITPAMVLLTVYSAVLDRWSESEKFNINMLLFNRNTYEPWMEDVIADFSNTLIFDVDFSKKRSFIQTAAENQKHFHERIKHSNYSGVNVLRDMKKYDRSSNVVFAYNVGQPIVSNNIVETFGDLEYMISQTPQVWIDFQIFDLKNGGLFIKWDSVDELFPDGMLSEMFDCLRSYIELLGSDESAWEKEIFFKDLEKKIDNIPYLHFIHKDIASKTLIDDFLTVAETKPYNTALVDGLTGKEITYAELKYKAMKLAGLLEENGIDTGDLVAVTMNKGISQIVAVLGVLAAGAGYVPVGVNQPLKRAETIYRKGNIKTVLTSRALAGEVEYPKGANVICIEDINSCGSVSHSKANPNSTAYVIFTSGSTGEPKGVVIKHKSAYNTIHDVNLRYNVNESDRSIAISALDFDLSVYDIFGMLSVGGAVVTIADNMKRDPSSWKKLVETYSVTVWNTVPAIMNMLLMWIESNGAISANKLRLALLSGDWIPLDLPEKFYDIFSDAKLVSLGGATEASIWSNYFNVVLPLNEEWNSIPYGYPLTNQLFRIVDKRGRSCPMYVKGELIIEGAGVANGYLNDSEKTKEAFFNDNGVSTYRTGDLGMFRENGCIEFLGRKDFQVKVNGYRIELSEIEQVLKEDISVEDAVCVLSENEKIYAFITPKVINENNNSEVDSLSNEETEQLLLSSSKFFANCSSIEEAEKTIKSFYLAVNSQTDRFIRKLISNSGLIKECITEKYKKYYDILADIASKSNDSMIDDNKEVFNMLNEHTSQIKDILYGNKSAVDILASPDNELTVSFVSDMLPWNQFRYDIIGNAIEKCFKKKRDKLKIAVLATRQGKLLQYLDNKLAHEDCEIDYLDNSRYYFNSEIENLKNINVNYRNFDINETIAGDCQFEYDIVIADNTLHRAHDVDLSLKNVETLLKQDGIVLMVEQNWNSSIVMCIAGLYEEGFRELSDRQLPLLDREKWIEKLGNRFGITSLIDDELMSSSETCIFALSRRNRIIIPESSKLISDAAKKLPAYMMPQKIIVLGEIPYTDNGKVNRKKLLELSLKYNDSINKTMLLPRNETEEKLVACFEKVLRISSVSVTDEFFSLGGDSLSAIRLINEIKEKLGIDITLPQIFTLQTVRNIAESISETEEAGEEFETGEI